MALRRMCSAFLSRRSGLKCFCVTVFGTFTVLLILSKLTSNIYLLKLRNVSPSRHEQKVNEVSDTAKKEPDTQLAWSSRPLSEPRKQLAILAQLNVIATWSELSEMHRCFLNPVDNSTRPCPVFCPAHNTTVELLIVDDVKDFRGKDAAIYGLSPFTALRNVKRLLKYSFQIPESQTAVLYSMESPVRVHKWIDRIGRMKYHVDLTYLPSSDIAVPYAFYKPGSFKNRLERKTNYAEGKTGLIAWMGSNCAKEVFWPRMEFIEELGRHLPLDTYGRCGNLTCLPRLSTKCVNLISTYKFYLALENSECREYITEKFWESSLLNGVVPVVYGAPKEDFEKRAPPNSYIHVSDFKSVKELAKYILKVDQSDELYNKYFEWRTKGSVIVKYPKMQPSYFCKILPFLGKRRKRRPTETRLVGNSTWFTSCRGNLTRRFNISQVPTLKEWQPWKLGVNDYVNGY